MIYKLAPHVTDEMLKEAGFIKKEELYGTIHYKSSNGGYFGEIKIYSGTTRVITVWNVRQDLFITLYQIISKGWVIEE